MKRMHRITVLVGIVVAALALGVPSAVAASPLPNHFTDSGSFTDPDFCGTGQAVDISFLAHGTEFLAPNQPVDYRNVGSGDLVYTNPLNGATVTDHFAGNFSETLISGDPAGVHTVERTFNGLIHSYRTDHGVLRTEQGVLYRGAGYVVVHVVRDVLPDGVVVDLSTEIIVNRGHHPDAESGFTLFCETIPPALGLS